jgi:hypothetical protein
MKSYFEDRDGDWVIRFDEQGRTVSSTFLFRMCHPSSTLGTKPSLLGSSRRVRSRRSTAWCAGRARDLIMRLHEEFGLSVSDDTIYGALKELGFSHVSARPKAYKQDAEAMEGVQKQLRRACGGSPRETCLGHTGRGMDPGRDRVGQTNKLTYRLARKGSRPRASHESTHPVDLSVRRGMPAKRGAGVALALPAASSRRDRHQGHPPAATPFSSRLSRLTWRKKTCASQAASRSCRCRRGTPRAQQPGKHLAVHASEPAVEPHLQIFSTTSSITAATPGTP